MIFSSDVVEWGHPRAPNSMTETTERPTPGRTCSGCAAPPSAAKRPPGIRLRGGRRAGRRRRYNAGTPPRLRGGLRPESCSFTASRSTPAPAGRTPPRLRDLQSRPKHPRACGEDDSKVGVHEEGIEAPPRLRGGRVDHDDRQPRGRSTPAPAGRTGAGSSAARRTAKHPRACGEDPSPFLGSWDPSEAPPRLRGGLRPGAGTLPDVRSTPAPAGRTSSSPTRNSPRPKHPRACEEDPS